MAADPIRDWTDELARDPASLVFLRLAELLRRRGRTDDARQIVLRGLERHPYLPDAHDVLARVLVDAGDEMRAGDEWEMALRLDSAHAGALKGLGFLAYRRGDLPNAVRLLGQALERDPSDTALSETYRRLRAELTQEPSSRSGAPADARIAADESPAIPAPSPDPRALFASLLGDGDRTAILLDRDGLVLAGTYFDAKGADVAEEIGAHLAGLAEEASRALRQLGLGDWESLLVEAQHATVAMAPAPDGAIVLVAAARDSQVGFVRRLLTRAGLRATTWLESSVA
jgi:predicted regulator of Ras-like GTPase activity (Roadblock/LC7/MglB family)/Tfp pilus assembly protein PilF